MRKFVLGMHKFVQGKALTRRRYVHRFERPHIMNSNEARDLANSMVRMYGATTAFNLASRYAHECTDNGDTSGYDRWAAAAALIGEAIEQQKRFSP
jgi:hypothetical protein